MIRLSQRALAYLNEVIHHGSLRRAAQHLNIDPSAISRQLASLEEHLGVRLLQRTPQGVAPTEAGELLVAHYRQQRANEEGVLSRLSALQGLRQGKVRLAVGEGFIADLISQPLQSFILRYPGIELEVRMAGANEGVALVKEDAVDLALVYAPVEDGELDVHVDTRQPLDLIIPANHALAGHRGAVRAYPLPAAGPPGAARRPRADRQPQGPRADRGGDRLPGTPAPWHALLQWRRARALAALRRCLFRITSGLE